jgi:hypothetical protein
VDQVEILMQTVQQEAEQLLCVVLPVASKLRRKVRDYILEIRGEHLRRRAQPHAPRNVSERARNIAAHAQRIS